MMNCSSTRRASQRSPRQHQPSASRMLPLLLVLLPLSTTRAFSNLPPRFAPARRVLPLQGVNLRQQYSVRPTFPRSRLAAATLPLEPLGENGEVVPSPAADPPNFLPTNPSIWHRLLAVGLGTLLTYAGHNRLGYNRVLSSAAYTLLASLVAPGLGQAAMCGSFAGFTTALVMPCAATVWALALVTGLVFEVAIQQRNLAKGLGGRLGFFAFVSVNITILLEHLVKQIKAKGTQVAVGTGGGLLSGIPFLAVKGGLPAILTLPAANAILMTLGYTALGAAATIWLRESWLEVQDAVRGAAYVGVAGGMLLYPLLGDVATFALYGGAFIGMSAPSRLERYAPWNPAPVTKVRTMVSFALAGLLAGGVSLVTNNVWIGGWGGKLGASSFLGAIAFRLALTALYKLQRVLGGKNKAGQ